MEVAIRDSMLDAPFEEAFSKAGELGFDGLEVFFGEDYRDHPLLTEAGIDRALALRDRTGCRLACFAVQAFITRSFISPDEGLRLEGIHLLNRLARVAPQFDVHVILIPFFHDAAIRSDQVSDARLIDGLRRAGDVAGRYGVALSIETPLSGEDHLRILDATGVDAVGICYDVGNAARGGFDGPTEIRELAEHITYLHMKDTDDRDLGEGRVDFDAVASAVRDVGYSGWFALETPSGDDPLLSAEKNLAFTRTFLDHAGSH